jgi:mono/diheme cytochrome c family protein
MNKTIIILSFLLIACGSAKLMMHSQTDVERGSKTFPGLTMADLDQGKALFTQNCQQCHGLKDPKGRSEEKWRSVVPRMAAKVNKKAGKTVLDSMGQQQILKYVVTMSTAPAPEKK